MNPPSYPRPLRDDRGAAIVEFVVVVPVLIILLAVMMTAGRLWIVRPDVVAIAREAAREAVTEPDAGSAAATATSAGQSAARGYGLDLAHLSIDARGPFAPGALYRVVVTYRVNLSDAPGLGLLPSSATISAAASEPISQFTNQ